MKIGLDFDGTVVEHKFPDIGNDIGAVPVLRELVRQGHKINLNTMRSGEYLEAAVQWFRNNGITLNGINEDPGQKNWTQSPKVFADIYIDDMAIGTPLLRPGIGVKPFVDWKSVTQLLYANGILEPGSVPNE